MSNNANNAKPKASRKLKVVTVVEATQVNTTDALVEQLLETTTAHIQNFTINSAVPLVAVPVKRTRATRAKVAEETDATAAVEETDATAAVEETDAAAAVGDGDVAVVDKRKSNKSVEVPSKRNAPPPATATDVAVPVSVGDVAVVNKRKSKKSVSDAEVPSKRSPPKRKPKSKAAVIPDIEPFTPSPSAFMPSPSPSATHNDVEVEEVSVAGVLYYKDVYGNLYDHTTFEPINN